MVYSAARLRHQPGKHHDETINALLIKRFLENSGMSGRELGDLLGVSHTTINRRIKKGSKPERITLITENVLAFLMGLAGEPVRFSLFMSGYELFYAMNKALKAAAPDNKMLQALRLWQQIEASRETEHKANALYALHKDERSVQKDGFDNPLTSPYLIPLLKIMGLEEEVAQARQGQPVTFELRSLTIADHFAAPRKELYWKLEQLILELDEEADRTEKELDDRASKADVPEEG